MFGRSFDERKTDKNELEIDNQFITELFGWKF